MTLKLVTEGWFGGNIEWDTYECTECGRLSHFDTLEYDPSYCPNCGVGATEDTELREDVEEFAQECALLADDPFVDSLARNTWWEASKELQEILDQHE